MTRHRIRGAILRLEGRALRIRCAILRLEVRALRILWGGPPRYDPATVIT